MTRQCQMCGASLPTDRAALTHMALVHKISINTGRTVHDLLLAGIADKPIDAEYTELWEAYKRCIDTREALSHIPGGPIASTHATRLLFHMAQLEHAAAGLIIFLQQHVKPDNPRLFEIWKNASK